MNARFNTGDRVRVREAYPPGHVRTPYYLRGKKGVVSRLIAKHPNPEELAYGRDDPPLMPVYWVRFSQTDIWPDYTGSEIDSAEADIQESWLELLEEAGK